MAKQQGKALSGAMQPEVLNHNCTQIEEQVTKGNELLVTISSKAHDAEVKGMQQAVWVTGEGSSSFTLWLGTFLRCQFSLTKLYR